MHLIKNFLWYIRKLYNLTVTLGLNVESFFLFMKY